MEIYRITDPGGVVLDIEQTHLIPKLIVELHELGIGSVTGLEEDYIHWRTGMVLQEQDNLVYIGAEVPKHVKSGYNIELRLAARSDFPSNVLQRIASRILRVIRDLMPNGLIEEYLACGRSCPAKTPGRGAWLRKVAEAAIRKDIGALNCSTCNELLPSQI